MSASFYFLRRKEKLMEKGKRRTKREWCVVEAKSKQYVPEEGVVMCTVAENSNRMKTLQCHWIYCHGCHWRLTKALSVECWGQTSDRNEYVGEEEVAMAIGNTVGLLGSGREREEQRIKEQRKERNRGSKKGLFLRCERLKLVYMLLGRCRTGGDHRTEFLRTRKWEQVEGLDSNRRRDTASATEELRGK